jgi:large subunit ribosomal protein L29
MASNVVKAKDLRGRTGEELGSFIREKQEELFKLRFQHFTGQLENVARMKQVRRELARAKTIAAEKSRSA